MDSKYPYVAIDKVASDIVREKKLSVPIDMGELFKKFDNIDVFESNSPQLVNDNVLGVVNKLPPKKFMIYYTSNGQSATRVRFTLAHELGHIKLGHLDDKTTMVDRLHRTSGFGGEDELLSESEGEANDFAGCLLMPKDETIKKWSEFKDINRLADYFKVSIEVASIRVYKLGLFKY